MRHPLQRAVAASALGVAMCCSSLVHAAPRKPNACGATYRTAQEREEAGRLRDARELFRKCSEPKCGDLEQRCVLAAGRLDAEVPSIVPVVSDASGEPVTNVQVTMDGAPLVSRIDGRAVAVDPGLHEFTFSKDGEVFATRKVMIAQGQRGPIAVALPASDRSDRPTKTAATSAPPLDAKAPPEGPPQSGRSALPYVIGGFGVLSIGAGALLTYWGRKDNDALAVCAPNCREGSVKHIQALYAAANISFGVGVVALAVSTVLFVTSGRGEEKPPRTSFDIHPTPSGAFTSIARTF
jgi:hypothetical protein